MSSKTVPASESCTAGKDIHPANILDHYKDQVLGKGSEGTAVYKGKFGATEVAIKRIIKDDSAGIDQINIFKDISPHENVIRYLAQEETDDFMYVLNLIFHRFIV